LRGIITDANGAAIPAAVVKIENKSLSVRQEATTDADGRFVVLNLIPATDYEMSVAANGFKSFARSGVAVISTETNTIDARLDVAAVTESVNVNATGDAQLSQTAELSQVINERRLNELPLYNRNLNRAALLNPQVRNTGGLGADGSDATRLSINGRIYRETHYKLDGNANFDAYTNNAPLQTVSLSAVQEYKILTNQYSAEHGGTTAGFLIATTKSGTSDFRGEGFFLVRPSGIQARPPLASLRVPNQLLQFGGSFGGPIFKDRTLFFANYEGTRRERGSFISLPSPGIYVGRLEENLGLLKIDHRFTGNHTASVRFNASRLTNDNVNDRITFNSQSAQQALPGTAVFAYNQAFGIQFNDNYVINSNLVNEFRVSYTNAIPSGSQPVTPSPVIVVPAFSTDGNGTFAEFRLQNVQIVDQMSLQLGRHSLKFGGDYTRQTVNDRSYQAFGTYTLGATPTAANPLGVSRFQQQVAAEDLRYGQTRFAAFLQDDLRFNSQLTFNLGVRYDYQSLIDDYNNFGPRLGFAYDVGGKGDTVVRGGAGMYYDQPFFHGFTQRYLLNGASAARGTIDISGAAAVALYPNSLDPRSPVPQTARRSLFLQGDDLTSPYTLQFSLGVQRKIIGDWVANADYIHTRSRGLLTAFNINAPSPFPRTAFGQIRGGGTISNAQTLANATRPFNSYRGVPVTDVLVSTNAGSAEYNALILGASKRFGNRYTFAANYVLSSSIDSITDDHLGANPNEWSDVIGGERSQTDFNQRHRFVSYGTIALPYNSQFSMVATIASGVRINPLTGVDNNGDGRTVDRPADFGRNSFVGKGQTRFDASLAKSFRVNAINETARFEIRADVFNLFNNSNFYRFNNVYGNRADGMPLATFGQPIGGVSNVDPGRQFQFTGRFMF
jgi:hypothetical protein